MKAPVDDAKCKRCDDSGLAPNRLSGPKYVACLCPAGAIVLEQRAKRSA